MLGSAVGQPKQTFDGRDLYPSLPQKAAALTRSLILNHAFRDANKRTGILSGAVFMMVNGCDLVASEDALYTAALAVEDKALDLTGLAEWFDDWNNVLPLTEEELDESGLEWLFP